MVIQYIIILSLMWETKMQSNQGEHRRRKLPSLPNLNPNSEQVIECLLKKFNMLWLFTLYVVFETASSRNAETS